MSASRAAGGGRSEKTVVLIGTLDTKGEELEFMRRRLDAAGVRPLLIDVGTLEPPQVEPDIDRWEVAAETGADLERLAGARDRGRAVTAMAEAAASLVRRLHGEGRCDAVLGAGGSGNTAIATAAMRALPVGVPKLMVSTLAAGSSRAYIGTSDLMMAPSVVDVAGLNAISRRVLGNAAAAVVGMLEAPNGDAGPIQLSVATTMFGVTTSCVTVAREELERRGYEVVTFHATGTGGIAMEELVASGFFSGVLDVTTTELCDELVGGTLSAGPRRLTVAGEAGLPQVVSLGALDMVNFGPRETVPARFSGRRLHVHNSEVTLMRTSAEECAELGREIGRKLSAAKGPTALFVPLAGVSELSAPGGPFHDAEADTALVEELRESIAEGVELHEVDSNINDPAFALAMAARLADFLEEAK
jgi:uncharacterized protein (UPF0261 family)